MICPNCGREIPDGTICPCTLEAAAPLSDNPAVNAVKQVGSSPLFLALAILFSVSALLAVFSSAWTNDMFADLYYYAYSSGMNMDSISYILDNMRASSGVSAVLGSIPTILVAVAAWIHYASCRSVQTGNVSTAGLTIYKVLRYIGMIGLCLAALLVVGVCVILIILLAGDALPASLFAIDPSIGRNELKLSLILIFAIIAAFFAFFMALAIGYQASVIRMVNRTKIIAASGLADDRVSGYLIGMNYVLAVFSVIVGIFSMAVSPLSGISSLVSAAALIVESILLSRYQKAMNLVIFPPVAPLIPPENYPMPPQGMPVDGNYPQPPAGDGASDQEPPMQ